MSTTPNNIFSTGNTNFLGRLPAPPTPGPLGTIANVAAATQPQEPQTNMIWVKSMDDVLNHVRTPNETLYFEDPEAQIIYIRETDGNGEIRNPLHGFHYDNLSEFPFGQEAKFVTKDEFQQLCNAFNNMNGKFDQVMANMSSKLDLLFPTNLDHQEETK